LTLIGLDSTVVIVPKSRRPPQRCIAPVTKARVSVIVGGQRTLLPVFAELSSVPSLKEQSMNRGKQKVVAGILAVIPLTGPLGIHHFYLGSTMSGVLLVIGSLCTVGTIPWIVSLIEGIMIFTMSDADFDARYNQREPESLEFVFMKPQAQLNT
jgi:TM2 domain-containing membrane protein YozV